MMLSVDQKFPRTMAVYETGLIEGLHLGGQFYVWRSGQIMLDVGHGDAGPNRPLTADTIVPWMSSGKPLTAAAILQLWDRGQIELDAPVARYIPEFAPRGKEAVAIRHLLTHTGGFRLAAIQDRDLSWDDIIARISAMKLERDWIPGQKAGYHAETSWYILGELVRRIDGRRVAQYVRDEIFQPLGMSDSWIGAPQDQTREYDQKPGSLFNTEHSPENSYEIATLILKRADASPGAAAQGPMHDLGRFYEMLLGNGRLDGARILSPETVELMTSRQRIEMYDHTFRTTIDWGLGLIVDSKRYGQPDLPYGYGRFASDRTFGHSGNQSSAAFADPQSKLVVAVFFNGMPGDAAHQVRMQQTLEAIYQDLGLTGD